MEQDNKRNELQMWVNPLVGEKLSSVTFVLDYWQIDFDGQRFTIWSRIVVITQAGAFRPGDDRFRDELCNRIGATVSAVSVDKTSVNLILSDNTGVSISFADEDYNGPEAFMFTSWHRQDQILVI